jgi:3-dehydro-L-gulonate 2-dehydrogenase
MADTSIPRINYQEIKNTLHGVLLKNGFSKEDADICSGLFTDTSLDGVYSHGLNRFPLFIENVRKGFVKPEKHPTLKQSLNNFEKWDGNLGPGNVNAKFCMDRAIHLAREYGTGIVSIGNSNHWLRGGAYGLQAANQNCIGICMTNTMPNMPPWGGKKTTIGNNPFIISVPHKPYPVLLDMAMSQFSYGKFEILRQQGKKLPMDGGYNKDFELTNDPDQILESMMALPTGYWKGSGLAIMIDMLVAVLSGGRTTSEIGELEAEYGLSQLFIALDTEQLSNAGLADKVVQSIIDSVNNTNPIESGGKVFYPGEQTYLRRLENEKLGIPVNPDKWKQIKEL